MKQIANPKLKALLRRLRPWLTFILLFLVLRYTGILSGVSYLANTALMKTGVMDIAPENNMGAGSFNYHFTIKDLQGREISAEQFKGKVLFLNLWATWCGPCRLEMPSIQELYNKTDHDKVAFVMLAIDTDESREKVTSYIRSKQFSFPVYQPAGSLPGQLHVSTIPTTFVIGADGKVKNQESRYCQL